MQGNPTALNNTHVALLRMDELGMSDSPIVHRAFVYILRVQRDDGGWNEDASIAKYDPPPWASPGEPWARVYLSAQSAFWLAAGGYRSHPGFQRALDFLLKHQEESGRFQGFPHSTWIATSAFVMAGAQYSETARKGLEAMVTKPLRRDVVQIIYRF
ncbi:MAG: terpene cyclase/mutase family protein [Anaerolineales bacterium]